MRVRSIALLAALALVVSVSSAWAQSQTGEIFGKVTDESGAVLPGVPVTLTGPVLLQPLTAITSETGTFQFPRLDVGTYTVKFELRRLQDGRQRGHPGHGRLQRAGQRAAGRLDRAGDRSRSPARARSSTPRTPAPSRRSPTSCCRASRRRATRGSSSSRRPASPWTARTSAATCRASSPTTCRAAATRPTTSGRSTASTSPTWRRPARRRATTTSTRSRK